MADQHLGEVHAKSGAVLIADPEALAEWCEDRAAFAALSALAGESIDELDFGIEGKDAEKAGLQFDRGWHPLYVLDATTKGEAELRRQFDALVAAEKLDARLVRVPGRITHPARVAEALRRGRGAGEISISGMLATVAAGVSGPLRVVAEPMPPGEHSRRWRWVRIELGLDRPVAHLEQAGYVTVESGSLVAIDPAALRSWKQVEDTRRALSALDAMHPPAAQLEVAGARFCIFSTSWGDGSFPVVVERDKQGAPIRLRVDLGSDQRVRMMHQVWDAAARRETGHLATVSARVAVDGAPVCWLYRDPPDRPEDSGWRIFAGDEDDQFLEDPDNARLVTLAEIREMDPTLSRVLDATDGAAFERDGAGQSFRKVNEWDVGEQRATGGEHGV